MQKIVVRVKTTRRPISDQVIGYRFQAATPNQDARKMKARKKGGEVLGFYATEQSTTAFTKRHLVLESSDYSSVNQRDFDRFKANLKGMGFTHYQFADKTEVSEL